MHVRRTLQLSLVCSLFLVLLWHPSAYAAATAALSDPSLPQATKLTAPVEISAQANDRTAFAVHFTTADDAPLADQPLRLLVDGALELFTRTDAEGVGAFSLPAVLFSADHELKVIFAGQDGLAATTATTMLRVHPATNAGVQASVALGQRPEQSDPLVGAVAALDGDQARPSVETAQWYQASYRLPAASATAILNVAEQLAIQADEPPVLVAHLLSSQGLPLADQELTLIADAIPHVQAVTDADGLAVFRLPAELVAGNYDLMTVFAGNDFFRPRVANTALAYHTAQPAGASAPVAAEAAAGASVPRLLAHLGAWVMGGIGLPILLVLCVFVAVSYAATAGYLRTRQDAGVTISGETAAALLAGTSGCAVFALNTVLSEASAGFKSMMTLNAGVGALSGKSTFAVLVWLILWALLYLVLGRRQISFNRVATASIVLLVLAVLGTFPPFFILFAAE